MKGQFPAVFNLTDLNGQNGFKIDAETFPSHRITSVGAAGDMNGDQYPDITIRGNGRSYVVFGGPGFGSSGVLALAGLNGTNGFKINSEISTLDSTGQETTISVVGDVNSDHYGDLLIGAPSYNNSAGRSYIVFGGTEVGSGGLLNLTDLNGANGFKLNGEIDVIQDEFGRSVSAAGDINGDHIADFIIGSQYNYYAGRSYVVFGGPKVGQSGLLNVSNLNGLNGFKIDGENSDDDSGCSISGAIDINSDGYDDLLIGADTYKDLGGSPYRVGRSYVVFGGTNVSKSGLISLSNLNGTNGFKLDGETDNDYSGSAVSVIGDMDGDGHVDFAMTAHGYGNYTGRGYVVFGGFGIGSSGMLGLASLNGLNGFKIDGESQHSNVFACSGAGDFNGDGYADLLIGASCYPFNATDKICGVGRTYVVFGGFGIGNSSLITLAGLNGANGFKLDGEILNGDSGYSVSGLGDINADGLDDFIIGVSSPSYVIFGDVAPQLWTNQITLHDAQTVIFTSQNLNATDNGPVSFNITNLQHGHFQFVNFSGVVITNFTQLQISNHQVEFVHDGSGIAPSYWVQTINSGIALSPPPQPAQITFYRRLVLVRNQLLIHQAEIQFMTSESMNITDDFPRLKSILPLLIYNMDNLN